MHCSKVINDEILKRWVYKVSKIWIFRRRSFFFNKEENCPQDVSLSICLSLNGLSFKHLPASLSHSHREKIDGQGESTQKCISVCNLNLKRMDAKRRSKKNKRYIIWMIVSSSTKWPNHYTFLRVFHIKKTSFS